jgi:limonene-1,2-epoxide hydrolase
MTTQRTTGRDTGQESIDVVERFLAALGRLDADAAVALLDDYVTYQNVPFPAARGRARVEQQLRGFARFATGFEAINHHIAADDGVVLTERMTERSDVIEVNRWRSAFCVCGTFEVRDGRIVVWRDRFDLVDITWASLRGAVAALLGRRR